MISVIAQINVWGQYIQQRALGQVVVMERESGTLLRLESIKDFHGGPVVKSFCQCRGHRFDPWSRKISQAEGQLNPHVTTTESECALQQEKLPQWEAQTLQLENGPHHN